jgi:hypothetical protein
MIEIECKELTLDEQLALAGSLSDSLAGEALALVSDTRIRFDDLSGREVEPARVEALVRDFISKRKDAKLYSLEWSGETMTVHTPDPLVRSRGRRVGQLPDNVMMCPFCSFVTPYQELYNVHMRSHGFGI